MVSIITDDDIGAQSSQYPHTSETTGLDSGSLCLLLTYTPTCACLFIAAVFFFFLPPDFLSLLASLRNSFRLFPSQQVTDKQSSSRFHLDPLVVSIPCLLMERPIALLTSPAPGNYPAESRWHFASLRVRMDSGAVDHMTAITATPTILFNSSELHRGLHL